MSSSSNKDTSDEVILKPMYRLPILIILTGLIILLTPATKWIALTISIFGLFLLIQSLTLKLKFTSKDLIVLQLDKEIRCFPYDQWLAWRIFFPKLPGILYFRETASPHLLPILFDEEMLESQLRERLGSLEIRNK